MIALLHLAAAVRQQTKERRVPTSVDLRELLIRVNFNRNTMRTVVVASNHCLFLQLKTTGFFVSACCFVLVFFSISAQRSGLCSFVSGSVLLAPHD